MTDRLAALAPLTMTGEAIGKNCKAIARTGKAFDTLVHSTGVAIIIASMPTSEGGHLDAGKALDYVKALPAGASRGRVVAWLHEFSNIRVTANKQEDGSMKWGMKLLKQADDGYRKARPIEANDTPFWDFQQDANLTPFVFGGDYLARSLTNIVRRYDKAVQDGKVDKAMKPADLAVMEQVRKLSEAVAARAEAAAKDREAAANKAAMARGTRKTTPNPNPARAKADKAAAKEARNAAKELASAAA